MPPSMQNTVSASALCRHCLYLPPEYIMHGGFHISHKSLFIENFIRCYEHGWGTRADAVIADYWYQQAAAKGLDWGMYNHANLLAKAL